MRCQKHQGPEWIGNNKVAAVWEKLPGSKPFFVVSKEPSAGYTICPLTNVPLVTFKPPTDLVKGEDGFYTWVLPLMYRCANACGRRKGVPLLQSINLISDDVVRDKLIDPFKFTLKVCERPVKNQRNPFPNGNLLCSARGCWWGVLHPHI